MENVIDEILDIEFSHDILSKRNAIKRERTRKMWRKDRRKGSRYYFVDTKFAKKTLHKKNRRSLELTSSEYNKDFSAIKTLWWALT